MVTFWCLTFQEEESNASTSAAGTPQPPSELPSRTAVTGSPMLAGPIMGTPDSSAISMQDSADMKQEELILETDIKVVSVLPIR